MAQDTIIYLTNIVIAVMLAGLLTNFWLTRQGSQDVRWWVVSVWLIALTAIAFSFRQVAPYWFGRFVPTLLVTVFHAALFLSARLTARQTLPWAAAGAVVAVHAAVLVFFIVHGQPTPWRMAFNGAIWLGLAVASFLSLRRGPEYFWKPAFSPANVFFAHALFHLLRMSLAAGSAANDWPRVYEALQVIGDLEATFFTVALIVSLLIATLQQRHNELLSARAEVETLSGLLPICAWCKKVRDDHGYWQRVEEYFEQRQQIRFTHGICADCADEFKKTATDEPAK